jgi:reactive intermediate/imine deaminase
MTIKKALNTDEAPKVIGCYSQAIVCENIVYVSGQIPLDPASMSVINPNFDKQAMQVFSNLRAVAEASGAGLNSFVKLTIYLTDLQYFEKLNHIMESLFDPPFPARAVIQVSGLPKDSLIEIEGIIDLTLSE